MKKFLSILLVLVLTVYIIPSFAEDNVSVIVDGQKIDTPAILIDGVTYVPLRSVSETMGAEVSWDGETKSAIVNSPSYEADITEIIAEASKSVVAITGNKKNYPGSMILGTGAVIKSGGIILTNAHVVENLENITVILHDGSNYPAKLQYIDVTADLAVVKINKLGLKPLTFGDPSKISPGQTVFAIGTPHSLSMRNSVSRGIVSGLSVSLSGEYYPMLQTDAAINGGNSGGPLINSEGKLIGINTIKYVDIDIESLALAIPLETINYVLSQFEQNGKVLRPYIGIHLQNTWEAIVGLPTLKGITVISSDISSLLRGDELIAVNTIPVHSITDYNVALRDSAKNGRVLLTVKRNGKTIDIPVDYTLK